jgi:hypothetical protein
MVYPRESQSQANIWSPSVGSTSSGYISDDSLLTKDLSLASDVSKTLNISINMLESNTLQSYFEPTLPYHLQADWIRADSTTPPSAYNSSSSDPTLPNSSTIYSPTFSQAPSPTLQTTPQPANFQSASDKLAYQTAVGGSLLKLLERLLSLFNRDAEHRIANRNAPFENGKTIKSLNWKRSSRICNVDMRSCKLLLWS